jgi:predicted RecA/RadA family phage recombinase
MKNAKGDGNTIEFTAGAALSSGDPVLIGDLLLGICVDDIANGAQGVAATVGVFEVVCITTAVAQGDTLYWDVSAAQVTPVNTGNTYAGVAWKASGSGVLTVELRLGVDKVVA